MSVSVVVDNKPVNVKYVNFSDGDVYLKIDIPKNVVNHVSLTIENEPASKYPWLISLAYDIIVEQFDAFTMPAMYLNLPYFPFARADRTFEKGMVCPLDSFLGIIESFDIVFTNDLHSLKYSRKLRELIDNGTIQEKSQFNCFLEAMYRESIFIEDPILICPDAGAVDKCNELIFSNCFSVDSVAYMEKTRDKFTGEITGFIGAPRNPSFEGRNCFIVDDLCDGGGTFIGLARILKEAGAKSVTLYVTHGIFSKSLAPFSGLIDKIICYHTVMDYVSMDDIRHFNKMSELSKFEKEQK